MLLDDNEMQQIEEAMVDGVALGTCDKCGHEQNVEPDGSYPCPECGDGKLQSVLMKYGLI